MSLKSIITGALFLAAGALANFAHAAPDVLASSIQGGIEDPANPAANATDNAYDTQLRINVTTGSTSVSFVVDLGSVTTVTAVALYGDFVYRAAQGMFSDLVTVSAGSAPTGPFNQIGSINVGNTRPTDPDPLIGGENPWTGGNGRLIRTATTGTRYLKIEGGVGFDNIIDVYALFINPKAVIHRLDPVYAGVTFNPLDIGGGPNNTRAAVDMIDGKYNTRTFLGVSTKVTLDFGTSATLRGLRFHTSDNDTQAAPKTGVIRSSSTEDPLNMDTVVVNYSMSGINGSAIGVPQTVFATDINKRYLQVQFNTPQDNSVPNGTANNIRLSEIELLTPANSPVRNPTVVAASVTSATVDGTDGLAKMFDKDYLERTFFTQIITPTTATTMSFVIDLATVENVRSLALYGDWTYRSAISMFGNDITVEAGSTPTGPFTLIGSRNVGNTRPTDPNPLIGGENPFTGGNGRLIPTTPTNTRYLRVTGGFGYDNNILVYEAIVNPPGALHRIEDATGAVDVNQSIYDAGGGQPLNSRVGPDVFDGQPVSRHNPRVSTKYTLDLGVSKVISAVRILMMDNDVNVLPSNLTLRASSTDDPNNLDVILATNASAPIIGGQKILTVTDTNGYRYLRLDVGDAGGTFRIGEIVVDAITEPPPTPTVTPAKHWTLY